MPETNTIKEAKVCKTCAFTRIDDGKVVCVLHCCLVRSADSCKDWKAYAPNSAAGPWQTGEPPKDRPFLGSSSDKQEVLVFRHDRGMWEMLGTGYCRRDPPYFWAEINLPKPNAAATAKCP